MRLTQTLTGTALALALGPLALADAAWAQEDQTLGIAITGSNDDFLAPDILDRWRSGALSVHGVRGPGWPPAGDVRFGEVLELRFHGQILSPESVDNPAPGDRPYATSLSFGVHSHWRQGGFDLRAGADLVITGPQTGLSDLQEALHEAQDLPDPSAAADEQIGDAAYLTVSAEAARPWALGRVVTVRPFAEARVGDETYLRVGADLLGGSLASGGLLVRDYATGHLVEAVRGPATGFGWSAGLDIAAMGASAYLPGDDGRPGPEDTRARARVGAMWAGERWSVFAGTSYLTEEFEGQDEGQIVGALAITFGF
ncbi:lipid A-modifier LpxR family protein [Rhodovulum sp. 12E13]|uniref:lipid A-modifier LpxR family protein n=1 Tax=Rhodovulum sp. 12E13 TaxID=2203891 RepID=UPI001313F9C3|nr:lipid A-modifier LpxR family protein [Rhodovulum sp. 12E13]